MAIFLLALLEEILTGMGPALRAVSVVPRVGLLPDHVPLGKSKI